MKLLSLVSHVQPSFLYALECCCYSQFICKDTRSFCAVWEPFIRKGLDQNACILEEYNYAQQRLAAAQQLFKVVNNQFGQAHCLQSLSNIAYAHMKYNDAQ